MNKPLAPPVPRHHHDFAPFWRQHCLTAKRSRQVGFFPSTWVFPGGRVDAADSQVSFMGQIEGLAESAFAVAGVRECYEEAGIWLGEGVPSPDLRDALNAREATLLDAPELTPNLSRLSWWSWWRSKAC